jgi:O-antigen ligase
VKSKASVAVSSGVEKRANLFAGLFGAFLGLGLLKFCNPPIMEDMTTAPGDIWEVVFGGAWPLGWAYVFLALLAVLGLSVARWKVPPQPWLIALPLVWLLWQCLAAAQGVDSRLAWTTVKHFAACVVCFYLGYFALSRSTSLRPFWTILFCALFLVFVDGWYQHFGGLEETRRYFYLYQLPKIKEEMREVPPELLKRVNSTRIYATLFYPNTLAGAVLLLLPMALGVIGLARKTFTAGARTLLMVLFGLGGLGCLFWSGSKGGWLLMLILGLAALLQLRMPKAARVSLLCAVLFLGLGGFFLRYSGFFQKGATSVTARFDYWQAAAQITLENPVFGTGPGTFRIPYIRIKRPESEPSRLVHNDYLEQASDSGLPGFLFYTGFIAGALYWTRPRRIDSVAVKGGSTSAVPQRDCQRVWVWLGVLGWALQGFMEFGLYVPALAWPAFAFLGWLLGSRTPSGNLV